MSAGEKRRELLRLVDRIQRSTTNSGILTLCQALHSRVVTEAAVDAVKPKAHQDQRPAVGAPDDRLEKLAGVLDCDPSFLDILGAVRKLKKAVDITPTTRVISTSECQTCIKRRQAAAEAQKRWRQTHVRPARKAKAKSKKKS